jgi:NADPH-dependent curcumin reductase CurA
MRIFLVRRIKIEGFIVSDHAASWAPALAEISDLVAAGKLRYRETVLEGLENAPRGLVDLLRGGNFGKMLVKVS